MRMSYELGCGRVDRPMTLSNARTASDELEVGTRCLPDPIETF